MKKIPTLFIREYENHKIVGIKKEVTPGCEEVLDGKCVATLKMDGSCSAVIDGIFYKRYDAKKGKKLPEKAIKCQEEADPITGHFPCWVPVSDVPEDKWFIKAFDNYIKYVNNEIDDGTYECIGKHFNGNKYGVEYDTLYRHGSIEIDELSNVKLNLEIIYEFLSEHKIEGIVFWLDGKPLCKIKRSDFGLEW